MDSRQAGVRPYVLFCSVIASLGTFSSGVNTSAFNIPGSYVRNCEPDPSATLPPCIPMGDWVWGVATGMFAVGGLVGAFLSGPMAERFGRRDAMIIMNTAFIVGAALISTSTTSAQFAIGRVIVGVASGFMTVVVSMYITEIAPPPQRGALVGLLQLLTTLGIFVIEAIGLGLQSAVGWRVSGAITVVPALVQASILPFCARSPRWLISKRRVDEARSQLLQLRRGDIEIEFTDMMSTSTTVAEDEIQDVPAGLTSNSDKDSTLVSATGNNNDDIERKKSMANNKSSMDHQHLSFLQAMRIPVLAVLIFKMSVLHSGTQLAGINAIMYYSTSIFEKAFDDRAAYVTLGVAALNIVITVFGIFLVDFWGRKFLLVLSSSIMCLAAALMTVGMALDIAALQAVCIFIFVAGFGCGLGIVPFLYTPECVPTISISAACSAALVCNWFFNFIIGLIFPTLQSACGDYVFLIFVGITFLLALFIFFFLPETKRKSIEDIGRDLGWYDLDLDKALAK
ncbi:general substrate transporter [Lichtheimia hyalospora FSU 10163]|nr:general substrate transporter [Lichtheimia hyalospora FSU 10163]